MIRSTDTARQGSGIEYAGESGLDELEELDGCHTHLELEPHEVTADADVAALVLYADVAGDAEAIELRRLEWEELLS